jgi:citrate lyase beta subunit
MRSKLFVPGSRPEFFAKALGGEADAVSFDLEDAVVERRKEEARHLVANVLRVRDRDQDKAIIVRVNPPETPHFPADLDAVAWPALDAVNLPKVESSQVVKAAAEALARIERARGIETPIGLLVNIESPRGLRLAAEIAAADRRVVGLQLGFGDLFEPLGIDRADTAALHQVRLAMRLAAGEAGVPAYDSAFPTVADSAGYRREAEEARRLGYSGKSCIHPTQVALANAAFVPSADEIRFARRVIETLSAADAGGAGAFIVDGRMVDGPYLRRAEAIVALAGRLGL